ncbi:hypothetical protein TWF718_006642 [Orbilia javanica]|uniref:Uncharacterized protein n=1 Tax=Orbilia javanica TaxID=47235 RepID=A0AAN8N1H0_9PEZI
MPAEKRPADNSRLAFLMRIREQELARRSIRNARRGRGRPPGSRSRSRSATSIPPVQQRVTRAQSRSSTNSLSPSPTRRRGRPPGSRNRNQDENVRPRTPCDGRPVGSSGPDPPARVTRSTASFDFQFPRPPYAGRVVSPPPQRSTTRPVTPARRASRRNSSPHVRQRVERMFAEMHENDVRAVSAHLARLEIEQPSYAAALRRVLPQHIFESAQPSGSQPSSHQRGPEIDCPYGTIIPDLQHLALQSPVETPANSAEPSPGEHADSDVDMDAPPDTILVPEDPDWEVIPVQSNGPQPGGVTRAKRKQIVHFMHADSDVPSAE